MRLMPQHQRLLRLSHDETPVVVRVCPSDTVRARQGPPTWFHHKQSPVRAQASHSQSVQEATGLPHLRSRRVEPPKTDTAPSCGYSPGTPHFACTLLGLPSGIFCIISFLNMWTSNGNYGLYPDFVVPLSQPGIPDLSLRGISSYASVPFTPTHRGLLLKTGRPGYPRRGTCLSIQLFPTLFCQTGLIDDRRDPWGAFLSHCSSNVGTVRSKYSPRTRRPSVT